MMIMPMYLEKPVSDMQSTIDIGNASRGDLRNCQQRWRRAVIPRNAKAKTDACIWFGQSNV